MLPSLEITNFKNIKHLNLPELGQVNLFTGKNNIGKSSLLEATYVLVNGAKWSVLQQIVDQRTQGSTNNTKISNVSIFVSFFIIGIPLMI